MGKISQALDIKTKVTARKPGKHKHWGGRCNSPGNNNSQEGMTTGAQVFRIFALFRKRAELLSTLDVVKSGLQFKHNG